MVVKLGVNWKAMTNQFNSLGAVQFGVLHLPGLFLGRLFASRTGKARVFNVARCAIISGSSACAPELPSRTDTAPCVARWTGKAYQRQSHKLLDVGSTPTCATNLFSLRNVGKGRRLPGVHECLVPTRRSEDLSGVDQSQLLASFPVPCFFWLRGVNRHSLGRLLWLNGGLQRA